MLGLPDKRTLLRSSFGRRGLPPLKCNPSRQNALCVYLRITARFAARRSNGKLSHFVLEFCEKFRAFDDISFVRAFSDIFLFVEDLHRERNSWTVDLNDLNFSTDDESDRNGFAMLEVDVSRDRQLIAGQNRRDTMHRGFLDHLHELWRGENVGTLVAGLLRRHPLFDPRLAAVGAADVEFRCHATGEYNNRPPAPARRDGFYGLTQQNLPGFLQPRESKRGCERNRW